MANPILVKLRPNFGIAAAASRVNLRPLHDRPPQFNAFGIDAAPSWYIADLPDTTGPNPWDLAHARVADQLGVDASAVLFAEPDLDQRFDDGSEAKGLGLAAAPQAGTHIPQDAGHNKAVGATVAWHLDDDHSQLKAARNAIQFSDPRTRIAHIDTGYDRRHIAKPAHIVLEHSFVDGDPDPNKAESRAALGLLPQNLDHGTGTIGILAGGRVPLLNDFLGGAPEAEIVTLRIADSVILFKTSAFAQALQFAIDNQCDVVSISMGGLPSAAWSELVNKAYENGICICAAAGNNIAGLPSHHVVYPARYRRAIAVCGVMADGRPYYDIGGAQLQGSWGPQSSMTEAIASYTPNIPWPVFLQSPEIRENGEGTSSATPQVAAAVALWCEKYKDFLKRDWRRVEAVRHALFSSAKAQTTDPEHFGKGILQARSALDVKPDLNRDQTPPDNDSFSFLRVITGLGIDTQPPRELMFNLELTQLYLKNDTVDGTSLQDIIADPEKPVDDKTMKQFMDAVIANPNASVALRKHIASRYTVVTGGAKPKAPVDIVPTTRPVSEKEIKVADPPYRRLRCYAVDPSLSTRLDTVAINDVVLKVRWEPLTPPDKRSSKENTRAGKPVTEEAGSLEYGEYLKVEDTDASGKTYPVVNLNHHKLLAQDGLPASEGNPQFHQQMVYAVAMKTIEHFEQALGRRVLWRSRVEAGGEQDSSEFVRQLVIKPHAFQQANAFYSPQEIALLFGYFDAAADDPGDHAPGSRVYACLSHDIVAHETTHAILDGMHKGFNEPTNPDVLAFHEAFADVVALMQHFTIPEILVNAITHTRGNLESESMLGSLAVQFGKAVGGRGALRDAIGTYKDDVWTRLKPKPADYQNTTEPHARGALLVAAIFDAFLAIYNTRTADLLRIYTGGTGVLPAGAIHPDLVQRLANEASKTAGHVLNICIRALDYIPPVDITFGEYLRGLITADADLVPDDPFHYRVAFVESFRKRGIYPLDLDTLSVDTLHWQGIDLFEPFQRDQQTSDFLESKLKRLREQLKVYANVCFYIPDRKDLFEVNQSQMKVLKQKLAEILQELSEKPREEFASILGIDPGLPFTIGELRRSMRVGPDGQQSPQIIVALTQSRPMTVGGQEFTYRGGSSLIVDLRTGRIQYAIGKRINSTGVIKGQTREQRTAAFLRETVRDPLRRLLLTPVREPFAALHSFGDIVS